MDNHHIPDDLIRKELSLIMAFEEIKNSHVLSKFIEFVVEKKLAGLEDEIKEYTIAVKGLGKPRDYNPQLDASVRIHAGRLRRSLAQYYQSRGKDDHIQIDIPKGSYVPVFAHRKSNGNGYDPQMMIVPAQAEELQVAVPIEYNQHFFDVVKKPVLAVLAFQNLSSEHSKDYFAAGIGEQLSTDLARFQTISVISYFSTSDYKADLKDLHEMKSKVQIDYVLTGSVRFIQEIVKINVQLILAENGSIIFTDTYTRHLTPENIFDIQDEIINQVANVIADDNGIIMNMAHASPFIRPENLSVQEAIYKFFDYTWDYSPEKFHKALAALEMAVQTEPNNALVLSLLAGLYMDVYITSETEDKAMLDKATGLTYLAVEVDPQCQHAQKALAWIFLLMGRKEKSFEAIEQCIKLNPKASSIIATMSLAYMCQGDYIRGFKWLLESIHLNPSSPASAKMCFALFYFNNRDYVESLKWSEKVAHLELPFFKLLQASIMGKLFKQKKIDLDDNLIAINGNYRNIIDRMIYDDHIKNEIIEGLELAGLTVS